MAEELTGVGARYFLPAGLLPGYEATHLPDGRIGWLATIREVFEDKVIVHCDGDAAKEVTPLSLIEFLKECTCEAAPPPSPTHLSGGGSGSKLSPRTEPADKVPSAQESLARGCCEKNPRCLRGYHHGGHGGRCKVGRGAVSSKTTMADNRKKQQPQVHESRPPQPAVAPAVPVPPVRKRLTRLPNPEDERVGKKIKIAFSDKGGRWYSASIVEARPCLSNFSRARVEYDIFFHRDGQRLAVDLDDCTWKWLQEDEKEDAFKGSSPKPSPPQLAETRPVPSAALPPPPSVGRPLPKHITKARVAGSSSTTSSRASAHKAARKAQPHDPIGRLVSDAIEAVLARARDEAAAAADDLPVMRKLRCIEWFAGSGRLSFALRQQHGWHAVIHDRNADAVEWVQHGEQADASTFRADEFESVDRTSFFREPPFDYWHFSIDCRSFTRLGWAGQGRNEENAFLGVLPSCQEGNRMLNKSLDMIGDQLDRNPKFLFSIENPDGGRMKDHKMIAAKLEAPREDGGLGAMRCLVDYCWFWDGGVAEHEDADESNRPFKKRTILWTNSPALIHELGAHSPSAGLFSRYLCERNMPCPCYGPDGHRAVNGSTSTAATPFPRLLAATIARAISRDASAQRWREML